MSEALKEWTGSWLPGFEEDLKQRVSKADDFNRTLWESMSYSLMAGGKRIRPVLMTLTALALGAPEAKVRPFAAALEMIHTYSLIHDDLPAMDNDDYRRGRLTNHKVFGEACAILAGDGLLNLAFEEMAEGVCDAGTLQAMRYIAHGAGPSGMIAGQIADMESETQPVGENGIRYIERNKTGRLLTAALVAGGACAGASEEVLDALEKAGFAFGTAFQIQDDILDIEGSLEELGKQPGSDEANQKETFITIYGMEQAKVKSKELSEEAIGYLEVLPGIYGELVRDQIRAMIGRRK